MAYEIKYAIGGTAIRTTANRNYLYTALLAAACIILAGVLIGSAGGDWAAAAEAMEMMAHQIGEGSSVAEAFSNFCVEILAGGAMG